MNKLDLAYQKLLQDILDNGVKKQDRTGTGTLSVFGRIIRHDMKTGFPLLTTKRIKFDLVVSELLWFLRGETNIKWLVEQKNYIWVGDAYKKFLIEDAKILPNMSKEKMTELGHGLSKEDFIERIKTDDEFAKKWGNLGPIYGKQWRSWKGDTWEEGNTDGSGGSYLRTEYIDQIQNLINDLKRNPDSRRLMVNAWNPSDVPNQVLPPCHYGFQCYTRELTWEEQVQWVLKNTDVELENLYIVEEIAKPSTPKRAISLSWNQRSVDTFLGLPFNIASYGLLLEIIAKEVNMVPDELIGNLGDTHLYLNHIYQAKEQISRGRRKLSIEERFDIMFKHPKFDPFDIGIGEREEKDKEHHLKFDHLLCDSYDVPREIEEYFDLPKLKWMSHLDQFESLVNDPTYGVVLRPKDFGLENYQSHPKIEAPLSN